MQPCSAMQYAAAFAAGAALFCLVCACDCGARRGKMLARFPLSLKYLLVIFAGGVLFSLVIGLFGCTFHTAARLLFVTLLAAVAMADASTMEIPDWLHFAIAAAAVFSYIALPNPTILSRILGVFCVSVPLALITLAIPGAFGGGDIKLMAACGLMLGWQNTLLAAFIALLLGGAWGAGLLILKKKRGSEHFAFGPCLCIGAAVCTFYGTEVAHLFLYIFDFSRFFT